MQGCPGFEVRLSPLRSYKDRFGPIPAVLRFAAFAFLLGGLLAGCASDPLTPSKGMARIEGFEVVRYRQQAVPYSDIPITLGSAIPSGQPIGLIAGLVLGTSWHAANANEKDYTETVYVYQVDGEPVVPSKEGLELDPGEHVVTVKYCRVEPIRTKCTGEIDLKFVAEADEHYRLRRNGEFDIELTALQAEELILLKKAGIDEDEDTCFLHRKRGIDRDLAKREIESAEADERLVRAKLRCEELVWGDPTGPS